MTAIPPQVRLRSAGSNVRPQVVEPGRHETEGHKAAELHVPDESHPGRLARGRPCALRLRLGEVGIFNGSCLDAICKRMAMSNMNSSNASFRAASRASAKHEFPPPPPGTKAFLHASSPKSRTASCMRHVQQLSIRGCVRNLRIISEQGVSSAMPRVSFRESGTMRRSSP